MADTVRNNMVVTRKPHTCWGCLGVFPAGSSLMACTAADGGRIATTYWCAVCDEIWQEGQNGPDDGVMEGEIKNADEKHWQEVSKNISERACHGKESATPD